MQRAELSIERRRGAPESQMLATLERLANTYRDLGRHELALGIRREAYSARLKVEGEEDRGTIIAALNYGESLVDLQRCAEAKLMLPKMMRAARRVLGNSHDYTLTTRRIYAEALYKDSDATLDDIRGPHPVRGRRGVAQEERAREGLRVGVPVGPALQRQGRGQHPRLVRLPGGVRHDVHGLWRLAQEGRRRKGLRLGRVAPVRGPLHGPRRGRHAREGRLPVGVRAAVSFLVQAFPPLPRAPQLYN